MDYYPVKISQLPYKSSDPNDPFGAPSPNQFSPQKLLEFIRTHINDFVNTSYSEFQPYSERYWLTNGDDSIWYTNHPLGALISIDIRTPCLPLACRDGYISIEGASVIAAEHSNNPAHWRFSTAFTPAETSHPVSGNREFGIKSDDVGSWVFYTRGADRTTTFRHQVLSAKVFSGADELWKSLQAKVALFINKNGGLASVDQQLNDSARYPWRAVCLTYWRPTTRWVDGPSTNLADTSQCR